MTGPNTEALLLELIKRYKDRLRPDEITTIVHLVAKAAVKDTEIVVEKNGYGGRKRWNGLKMD